MKQMSYFQNERWSLSGQYIRSFCLQLSSDLQFFQLSLEEFPEGLLILQM